MKPRLAILHYSAPPVVGGVESTIAAHARLLADHGYTVKILAGRGESFDPRAPVEIIPTLDSQHPAVLQVARALAGGTAGDEFRALAARQREALEQALGGVEVCLAHNVATLHKNLALTLALHDLAVAGRVRLIAWCHDFAWRDPLYAPEMHPGLPWDLLRRGWPGVKYVVVSEARRKELAELFEAPVETISAVPPGVDPLEFLGIGEPTAGLARRLKVLEAAPLLLLPMRVTRRKNIGLALQITAALRDRGMRAMLAVLGPLGPHNPSNRAYLDELRAQRQRLGLGEAAHFLQEHGAVDEAARRAWYALADALLLTSAREGFGIPVLEAAVARLPVFCSDLPSFHESAGDRAYYFALDEPPAAIAARMAQFFETDGRYQLKQRVQQEYAWERIFAARIEPLLKGTA